MRQISQTPLHSPEAVNEFIPETISSRPFQLSKSRSGGLLPHFLFCGLAHITCTTSLLIVFWVVESGRMVSLPTSSIKEQQNCLGRPPSMSPSTCALSISDCCKLFSFTARKGWVVVCWTYRTPRAAHQNKTVLCEGHLESLPTSKQVAGAFQS